MLFPGQKPSSSYSLLKFVYVSSQLYHFFAVHPLLRKILDPPCRFNANLSCLFVECDGSVSVNGRQEKYGDGALFMK